MFFKSEAWTRYTASHYHNQSFETSWSTTPLTFWHLSSQTLSISVLDVWCNSATITCRVPFMFPSPHRRHHKVSHTRCGALQLGRLIVFHCYDLIGFFSRSWMYLTLGFSLHPRPQPSLVRRAELREEWLAYWCTWNIFLCQHQPLEWSKAITMIDSPSVCMCWVCTGLYLFVCEYSVHVQIQTHSGPGWMRICDHFRQFVQQGV